MWGLDRLSALPSPRPSPPPGSRDFSPARRSFNPTQRPLPSRPELSSRTSSLLLSRENSQQGSVPYARNTGSSLKHQLFEGTPADVEDPVEALNKIIGIHSSNGRSFDHSEHGGSIDFGGKSLEEFAADISDGTKTDAIPAYSQQTIEDYGKEQVKLEDLHKSITACDDILRSVEQHLGSFRSDLGVVATEIETLQTRSTALNGKLEGRRKAEELLGPIVARTALSPGIVRSITEGPFDEHFTVAVEEIAAKIKALDDESGHSKAAGDLRPLLEELSKKVVERVRDYFAGRIKAIRAPNINAQHMQANDWLKYKSVFGFLAAQQPELAEGLIAAYTNTMRWYYASHFSRYQVALSKLKLHVMDRSDLLGEGLMGRQSTNANRLPGHDPFNLGRRIEIMRSTDTNALAASTAEESKIPTFLETPFASFNLALLDNASYEYAFLSAFLPSASPLSNPRVVSQQFGSIFASPIEMANALSKSLISESFDAVGILLAVRLNQRLAFVAQRRKLPTLESYMNGVNLLLWPRFQVVMDAHCESLKRLVAASGSSAAGAALASLSGGSSSARSTAPHPVTQRFASLLQAILTLSSEAGDDEPVSNSLGRLRNEYDAFLSKLGGMFGAGDKGRRERERFMANNYSLVLTIVADATGRLADECRAHFEAVRGIGR